MTASQVLRSCLGAGEHQGDPQRGGARWIARRGICRVCGKQLTLTKSGRIPPHAPGKNHRVAVSRWD